MNVMPSAIRLEMTPMTMPDSTYCERRVRSIAWAPGRAAGPSGPGPARYGSARHHEVAGLELGRVDDLGLGEGHLGLGVLQHQHRRGPLLPVGPLAAGEA